MIKQKARNMKTTKIFRIKKVFKIINSLLLYADKFENLDEMDYFLEKGKLSELSQEIFNRKSFTSFVSVRIIFLITLISGVLQANCLTISKRKYLKLIKLARR